MILISKLIIMNEKKADVIFHPVRMRIVQALFGERRLTAQQIAALIEGPSIATLYRHLNRLIDAQVIQVVEERPIRGTVEKVYALAGEQAASFSADESRQASANEQKHNFNILLGTLQGDYERYLDQGTRDSIAVDAAKSRLTTDAMAQTGSWLELPNWEAGSYPKARLEP